MEEQELKQMRLELNHLQKVSAAQAATLTLLLGVLKKANQVHPANIAEGIDSLNLHPIGAGDLKREAKKLIPVYFP